MNSAINTNIKTAARSSWDSTDSSNRSSWTSTYNTNLATKQSTRTTECDKVTNYALPAGSGSGQHPSGTDYTALYAEFNAAQAALWSAYGKTDADPTVADLVRLRTEKTLLGYSNASNVRDIEKFSDPDYFSTSSNDQYRNRSTLSDPKTGTEIDDLQERLRVATSNLGTKHTDHLTRIDNCQVAKINVAAYQSGSLSTWNSLVAEI